MDYNKKEQLFDKINGLRLTSTNASDTLYNRGVVDAFRCTNEFFDEDIKQFIIEAVKKLSSEEDKEVDE